MNSDNKTEFQLIPNQNFGKADDTLCAPILASFPNRMPSAEELKELKLCIKQQKKDSDSDSDSDLQQNTKKRRVILGSHKNIDYSATTFGP